MAGAEANPETLQAVIDDARRTVALAAWKGVLVHVDAEASRLAGRHPGAYVPATEIRGYLLRLATEQRVPAEIG